MKKIIIIGSGGAGKSTLAQKMSKISGLPVFHLDSLFWNPGWVATENAEWEKKQKEILKNKEWIIDGNYGGTMELRFAACDTVIFLNFPRLICLYQVFKRFFQFRGAARPDMQEGCHEKIDIEFLKWIWTYPKLKAPKIIKRLNDLSDKKVIILESPGAVKEF